MFRASRSHESINVAADLQVGYSYNMDKSIPYKVVHRKVKHPRLEFKTKELTVIVPHGYDPEIILTKYDKWISRKHRLIQECLKDAANKEMSDRTLGDLKDLVGVYLADVSRDLDVQVNKILFRKMRTKWASCSSHNNLTFNTLMTRLPDDLVAYIVLHEAAHMLERNHKKPFWNIITRYANDYKAHEKELHTYWYLIQDA